MKKIQAQIIGRIISTNSSDAYTLHKKSSFGEPVEEKVQYSFSEALFLVEKGKMDILVRGKKITKKELLKKLQRFDKKIQTKYPVFKDLREKGYVVKTALKFGAEFRVYEKSPKSERKAEANNILSPVALAMCTGKLGPLCLNAKKIFFFISEVSCVGINKGEVERL